MSYKVEGSTFSEVIPENGSYSEGDNVAVRIQFVNDGTTRYLSNYDLYLSYDATALKPYTYKSGFSTVGPAVQTISTVTLESNEVETGKIMIKGMSLSTEIPANATVTLAWVMFTVKNETSDAEAVETGSYDASIYGEKNKISFYISETDSEELTGIAYTEKKAQVPVTGALPTLASVSIKANDEGGLDAVYGQTKTYTLTALSTKGKDISGNVTWSVSPSTGGISLMDNKLTVSSAAVREYTVTATPKTNECQGNDATATFNVTKAPVTSVKVTISNFAKGLEIENASAAVTEPAGVVDVQILGWYVGQGTETAVTETHFKANTTYTAKLQLTLKDTTNYEFKDAKATVKMDDTTTVNPSISAEGIAEATATTAQRTKLAVSIAPRARVTYGTLLKDVVIGSETAGKIVIAGTQTEVKGTYEWDTAYAADEKVGGVIYPSAEHLNGRAFKAKFIPTESEIYETLDLNAYVIVTECPISISGITALTQNTFVYNGEDHTVALDVSSISADLADQLKITYDGDVTKKNVGNYEVTATIDVEDPAHYMISDTNKTRTLSWSITPGTLTPDSEQTKEVLYGAARTITYTPHDLGLPEGETFAVEPSNFQSTRPAFGSVTYDSNGNVLFMISESTIANVNETASVDLKYTSENYNEVTIKLIVKIVDKTPVTLDVDGPKPASFPYGTTAEAIERTLTISNPPAGVELTYTYTDASGNTVSDISKATPAENYKVTISGQDAENVYTGTYTFEITPRSIADATITFDKTLTYNGKPQEQTMTVKVGDTSLTANDYELATESAALTQKDAGEYKVIINGKGNYTGTKEATFKIAQASLANATINVTGGPFTYNGEAQEPAITVTCFGEPLVLDTTAGDGEGDYIITYKDNTNAGTATIEINATSDSKNYYNYKTTTFKINPKTVSVDDIEAQNKEYDGTNTATLTATLTGVVPKDKDNVSLVYPTATFEGKDVKVKTGKWEADKQTVIVDGEFSLTGSAASNYVIDPTPTIPSDLAATINFKTLTLDDAKKTMTVDVRFDDFTMQSVSLPVPTGLIKGDGVTHFGIEKSQYDPGPFERIDGMPAYNSEDGSIKFKLDETKKTEQTATLKYPIRVSYGNNYDRAMNLTLIINISIRSAQSTLTYTGATSVAYGQSITLTSAGGSGTGAVTYAIVGGDGAATISGNVLTATKAGTVKIQVTKAGDKDYLATTSAVYDITVTKAIPAAPAEIKVDNTDTTLGELGKDMADKIGVPGKVYWFDSDGKQLTDDTKIEANKEYNWTFVPADSTNYSEIKGTTTPYVRDDLSWLPGVINGGSSFSFHDVNRFDYYYDSVKWAADNGIASGTSRFAFSPDAVCTRAQIVTFLWRAAGSPLPRYRACPFTDVHSYDYYYEAVLWAVEQGITTGLTATTFGPDETVTRGQVATFLYRAASAAKPNTFNPFTDVKPTAYNYDAILWAYDNRITTGTSTTTFSPDAFCTRAQIVTFLYRFYQGR